jgi:EF-hand domain pair
MEGSHFLVPDTKIRGNFVTSVFCCQFEYNSMAVICSCSNILTRSSLFRKISHWAFEQCDTDHTGHVQFEELHRGILLVHLQLAKHMGVAACYPPSRQAMENLFHGADDNRSGTIDEEEFLQIMMIACAQITSRMIVYYTIIIIFVPHIAHSMIRTLLQMDEYMGIKNSTAVIWMERLFTYGKILESTVSLIVFMILVPYLFDWIDSYSHQAAIEIHSVAEDTTVPRVPTLAAPEPPVVETKKAS